MIYDVTTDRNLWIGGSDIPCIMGISPFKTRYDLLLEKAELKENDFKGNRYTEYGNVLEPQIRDYINKRCKKKFEPSRKIVGDIRCHTDGFNGECVLEIKTTSHIYETAEEYQIYLVQLLLYMQVNEVKKGILAVYERPTDFSPVFDPQRLQTHNINIRDYKELLIRINTEIERFRADLKRLKENPLLSEQDFQDEELVTLSNKVVAFENQLSAYKQLEKDYETAKKALYEAMKKHEVKAWTTPNGTRISRIDEVVAKVNTVLEFDIETFKKEKPALYKDYTKSITKKTGGRKGYVKITLPKGGD